VTATDSGDADPDDAGPERPVDPTPVHTEGLPATPQRHRTIPATAWVEAPPELLDLGADYMALAPGDPSVQFVFRLFPDGSGEGVGPDGELHHRFRMWKEALRDHASA